MKSDYEKIRLFKEKTYVYLVNMTEVSIKSLVYSTFSSQLIDDGDGTILYSGHLYFRIEDIPAKSYLELEIIDPYEDGSIHYILENITWANGLIEENIKISLRMVYGLKRTGTIDLNVFTKSIREKVLINESLVT
jgi:hypothetical protein